MPITNSRIQNSSIVYITDCPTAYAMYVNIVGTDDAPPLGMSTEVKMVYFS